MDQNGKPVSDGRVIFKVNGKTLRDDDNNIIYALVSKGTAFINYKVQSVWLKNTTYMEAVYSGSEKYNSSRIKSFSTLNISKGNANITLEESIIKAKVGQTITLRTKILDTDGDRINCDKVVFKINGKSIRDNKGNIIYVQVVDGEAVLDYTLPSTYSAKIYNLSAVFGGGNYERAETTGKLIMEKKGVIINTDSITTTNKKTSIIATITDETGNLLIDSTKIAVKINGKTILNNVTSTNGKIDMSFITSLEPGMYELLIISGENGLYKTVK